MKDAKNNNVEAIKEQLAMAKNHVLAVEHSLRHGLNGATFHDLAKAECEVENLESELRKLQNKYYIYSMNTHTGEKIYNTNYSGDTVLYSWEQARQEIAINRTVCERQGLVNTLWHSEKVK